ncbi:MAG TPA: HlyD family efflux transporter periplasmic adaptor subunit [Anaerolineae bacterium]|jgi:HlyD family secretion protein
MNQKKPIIIALGLLASAALVAACSAPGTTGSTTQSSRNGQTTGQRITVQTGSISNHIIGTGTVVARASAQLAFSHSGTVKTVNVKIGDSVKAGQALASLDTTDLELTAKSQYASYISALASYSQTVKGPSSTDLAAAQAGVIAAQEAYSTSLKGSTALQLNSAYASIKSAQTALDQLSNPPTQYDVASAEAAMLNAKAAVEQAQAAYDTAYQRNPAGIGGTSAGLNLQQATNNYNSAKAAYDKLFQPATASSVASARAQVASAQSNLDNLQPTAQKIAQAKQALDDAQSKLANLMPTDEAILMAKAKLDQAQIAYQQAQKAITDATIKSPYDGMVALVNIDPGDTVGSSTAIEVADFTVPQFQVNVDEADLGNVKVGEDAVVQLQTYPNLQIPAKVEQVDASGTTAGSIVTFKVYLSVSKAQLPDGTAPVILLGMSGTSQIVTQKADNATLVPNKALIVDAQTKAFSVNKLNADGSVTVTPITVGFRGTDSVQALTGVNPGDVLVIPTTSVNTNPGFGPGGGRIGGGG